jgi:hypothetical protein
MTARSGCYWGRKITMRLDIYIAFQVRKHDGAMSCEVGISRFQFTYLEAAMDKHTQDTAENSNMVKDRKDWTTADEPMTGAQKSYLSTLCQEAGEEFDEHLSKAAASKRIDKLQHKTGRGLESNDHKH